MGRNGWLLAGLLALGLVACGAPTDVLESLPTLAPTIAAAEDPGAELRDSGRVACDALDGSALNSGRLAVVCHDENIYVVDSGGGPPLAVTDDAVVSSATMVRQYHSPTWSASGWLSYVMTEAEAETGTLKNVIYAVQPGGTPRQLLDTEASNYIYGYWSPAECGRGPACGRFAFLMSAPDAVVELHVAEVRGDTEEVEEQVLGEAGSLYYSWAPDGERMLWFRGGTTLEVVDLGNLEDTTILPDEPGVFQAPWWSPVDERWLFASAGESGDRLVIAEGDERSDFIGDGAALSAFAWSPDGRQLAYAEGFPPSPYPYATLSVHSDDGQDTILLAAEPLLAFFWSPDSQKVAFVGLELGGPLVPEAGTSARDAAPARQQVLLVWKVADVTTGEVRELASFAPTRSQLYIIQFFDQFAQSHNVWSPDSSQIVYAEQQPGGAEIVNVIDVESVNARPTLVGEGSLGVFSYD
jgi:TolB protein